MLVADFNVNEATITLFKVVVTKKDPNSSHQLSNLYLDILVDALKHGVLIDPEIIKGSSYKDVAETTQEAIDEYGVNVSRLNSTFYKRFADVENNSELQLRLDQLVHYASTYGHGYKGTDGDMTNLNQYGYAAEFYKLSVKRIKEPMIVNLSDFHSDSEVKFDVFVTGANVSKDASRGVATQIDDKSVLFHDTISPSEASKVLMLVFPTDKGMRIAFTGVNYGNMYIPKVDNSTSILIDLLKKQVDNVVTLNELIELLGGHITSDIDELRKYMKDNAEVSTSEIVTTASGVYAKVTSQVPEIINLVPSNVTQSTFIDLLNEPEEV